MRLTLTERLLLANQLRILELLDPAEASHYKQQRQAIEDGYELEYGGIAQSISSTPMSTDECSAVMDVLDMYRDLTFSARSANADGGEVRFPGFDGNNEPRELGYVMYLFSAERWKELQRDGGVNSHAPMKDRYRRMLNVWRRIRRHGDPNRPATQRDLTADEIRQIIDAG